MYQALYRKYRPRSFDDVVGQEHITQTLKNQVRNDDDIQRIVYSYIALAEKHGHLKYVTAKESLVVKIHKAKDFRKLQEYKPTFLCMNDSELASDKDRQRTKEMLEHLFPDKSEFEK